MAPSRPRGAGLTFCGLFSAALCCDIRAMSDHPPGTADASRLAVFDMDGTLVDSQHMIVAAMSRAFATVGLPKPEPRTVRRVVGLSLRRAIAELVPGMDGARMEDMESRYKEAFSALREAGEVAEVPFDGAVEVLDLLAGAGWVLGIATGKSSLGLAATLERFGLTGRFSTLQTADQGPGKPAPDMLHRAMDEAGVEGAATVMIGDTSFDMAMARSAGVAAIGVSWGYHESHELLDAGASRVVSSFAELPMAIEDLIPRKGGAGHP